MPPLIEITTAEEAATVLWRAYGPGASGEAWDRMADARRARVDENVRFWRDVIDTVEALIRSANHPA